MRIVIIHGTMGNPSGNWFPWLKYELEVIGHEVIIPQFPTPEDQYVSSWLSIFNQAVPDFSEDTILVGHSIGATLLLNILHSARSGVLASVFVAPVMGDIGLDEYDTLNSSFYAIDFDWPKISLNAGKSYIFHGDNDPYVPLSHSEMLGRKLDIPLTIVPKGGHLNAESGY